MSKPLDLNPGGMCMGPDMKGCPHGASAPPPRQEGQTTYVRYHCDRCLPLYCRKYNTRQET